MDFDSTQFASPTNNWEAPYLYCPKDVLFPVENRRNVEYQILEQLLLSRFVVAWVEQSLGEELLAKDSQDK